MFVAVALVLLAACGSDSGRRQLLVPNAVPTELVPATLEGNLTLTEYEPARKSFAQAGVASLVSDGRVWAIRRGQTLVGTLQISAVKHDVSLSKTADHKAILDGVMTGTSYETIDVGETKVVASTAADRTLYLWFGRNLFQVLQLKGTKVDPDTVAADLIAFQQSTGKL
jgi:hypothetical protein